MRLLKDKEGIANTFLCDTFPLSFIEYNLRFQTDFPMSFVNTSHFYLKSLQNFAYKVPAMVPLELKNVNDVGMFIFEFRKWEPRQCECKVYVLGYVNINNN